ncbi:hypothetical protein E1B28_003421 [Marasmius oreades]|uniref:Uncharacterized protein n=1 Tax=Marasmius oreades TaxID=181124 RepID=A0A9P7RLX1_9AGAR|nr:uncharacterized protein E1B28_003421 [Marasmius oreades]KAG7085887.1 hypothetical protein E1B28_003421 [Marasmius oreades]
MHWNFLPRTLLFYLFTVGIPLIAGQGTLTLGSLVSFTSQTLNVNSNNTFSLPNGSNLTISVSICSFTARFFITNNSDSTTINMPVTDGVGVFSGRLEQGGVLSVESEGGSGTVQLGLSEKGPLQEHLANFPVLGDTTSNQALLFSPPYAPQPSSEPTYPNYTLPVLTPATAPSSTPNFTLVLLPSSVKTQLGCVLQNSTTTVTGSQGNVVNRTQWLRDAREGWREQLLVDGLLPQTNYSAFFIQDGKKISGPAYFVTKSSAFSCPLAASLPFCPGVSYAVPLPPPPAPSTTYDASNIPQNVSDGVTEHMANFTISLTTFACGRDFYSPIKTCSDCQREYRKWLCTIAFPRCGEAGPSSTSSTSSASTSQKRRHHLFARLADTLSLAKRKDPPPPAVSALAPVPDTATSRSPFFAPFNASYNVLLPCIETCQATDRACPYSLGFKCPPTSRFIDIAKQSYGVGIVDGTGHNQERLGFAGTSVDTWGNIWCNGG